MGTLQAKMPFEEWATNDLPKWANLINEALYPDSGVSSMTHSPKIYIDEVIYII